MKHRATANHSMTGRDVGFRSLTFELVEKGKLRENHSSSGFLQHAFPHEIVVKI